MTTRRVLASLAVAALLAACAAESPTIETGPPPSPTSPTSPTPSSAPAPGRTPTPASDPEPAEPREVSILMGGDLLWHNSAWQSAADDARTFGTAAPYSFDAMFADLQPIIAEADLAICHEEVPFARPGQELASYPVFAAPPHVGAWVAKAGFDACTTASNHSVDQGFEGLLHTADVLDHYGVAHVGTFRTEAERRRPVVLTAPTGVRVGIVAGTYGLNGFPLPEGRPWSVSMWDAPNLLKQARAARRAGADVVVVHLHGGAEYDHDPTPEQVELVERLTRSPDVDLVLGEHAHVVQPITRVNGKWVAYGMGNMVAQQETARPDTYEGITVRFTFREQADGGFAVTNAAYVPTVWNVYGATGPIRIQRISLALHQGRTYPVSRERLLEARGSIREAVNLLGRSDGLVER